MTAEGHMGTEGDLLSQVAERYRRQGYDVLVEPLVEQRPDFLSTFHPDLIARRGEEYVVVEVKMGEPGRSEPPLRQLAAEVARHPGWRLDLVFAQKTGGELSFESLVTPLEEELVAQLSEGLQLCRTGHLAAGVLLIWASFEGAARLVSGRERLDVSPTAPPLALIRALVSDGLIDDAGYEVIKLALQRRNAIAHGFTSAPDDLETYERLHGITRRLLSDTVKDD